MIGSLGKSISACRRNSVDLTKIALSSGMLLPVIELQNTGRGLSVWMAMECAGLCEVIGRAFVSGDLGKIPSFCIANGEKWSCFEE